MYEGLDSLEIAKPFVVNIETAHKVSIITQIIIGLVQSMR